MSREIGSYLDELVAERGEPCDWEAANRMVQEAALRLGKSRQRQYGHDNIAKFGLHGIVIRSTDKLERLKTMVWRGEDAAAIEESVEDTCGDLANYSVYGVLLSRGWWMLPLLDEPE